MFNKTESHNFSVSLPINGTELARGILLSVLCVASAIGNTWALFYLLQRRRRDRDSVFSLSLLNLCVADLITTAFRMGGVAAWTLTVVWLAGDTMCKVFKYFQVFGSNASTHLIMFIGIDRALSVRYPINSISSARRRVKYLHIAAWTASALCSSPQPFLFHLEEVVLDGVPTGYYECACTVKPSMSLGYSMFVCVTSYLLPVLVLTASYSAIFITIRKRSAEKLTQSVQFVEQTAASATNSDRRDHLNIQLGLQQNLNFNRVIFATHLELPSDNHRPLPITGCLHDHRGHMMITSGSVCSASTATTMNVTHDNRKVLFRKARRRSSLTFFIVVISFLVCWTPYYIMYLVFSVTRYVDYVHSVATVDEHLWATELAYWLNLCTHLNTLLNPLIYRSVKFNSFQRIFKGSIRDRTPHRNVTS